LIIFRLSIAFELIERIESEPKLESVEPTNVKTLPKTAITIRISTTAQWAEAMPEVALEVPALRAPFAASACTDRPRN
jgi:hypothetical protein